VRFTHRFVIMAKPIAHAAHQHGYVGALAAAISVKLVEVKP
jgi:hypothetical protein